MFTLAGVGVAAGGATRLHPLDLVLGRGGVTGLIGHNGSGKSTLLRVLARQLPPSTGRVAFDGRALPSWPARAFARQVAFLPQDPPAAPELLVRELVALGRYAWTGPLGRLGPHDRDAVEGAMERCGVRRFADRPVAELSGGERQCAWVAMCVAQEARVLLLDEPTAALDLGHQRRVLEVLQSLHRDHGIGIVVVLHDINLAARFCDELLALRAGRLVARGDPAVIMQADVLAGIYGVELGLLPHPGGRAPIAFLP